VVFDGIGHAPCPSSILNKHTIVEKIIAALGASLEVCLRSVRDAHAGATDEQNKAENKYDTRGLEAGYLARGQSRQATEVMQALQRYEALVVRPFAAHEAIDVGAVVELERGGERTIYFVGPLAGGAEFDGEGGSVQVITPQSPLGRQLVGHRQGERLQIKIGGASASYRIVAVT